MIGAIIGDIVGSRFEFDNHHSKSFELFTNECRVTDDSIMSLAIAKALMETEKTIQSSNDDNVFDYGELLENMAVTYMQEFGRKYPNCGFGGMFSKWIFSEKPEPYNSFGNGAAMRISPIGFWARTESEASVLSEIVTGITHNHKEGFKGAEATAIAIFMARRGCTKSEIRDMIDRNYYRLDFSLDDIRETYVFDATCQGTVPQAIVAFLESTSFEDAVRTAISIGGDSDTIAAITGSIAEAYYGIPESIKEKALTYLDSELLAIYADWCEFNKNENLPFKFKVLTKYIGKLADMDSFGEWLMDHENDGTTEQPVQMPFVQLDELVDLFVKEFYQFSESHPEYELTSYRSILESNGMPWGSPARYNTKVDSLNEECILSLIMGAIRANRFSEGILLSLFKEGLIEMWLKRLKSIDDEQNLVGIAEIVFQIGGFGEYDTSRIVFEEVDKARLITTRWRKPTAEKHFSKEETINLLNGFKALQVDYWKCSYIDPYILDGTQWSLAVTYKDQRCIVWQGSNDYPKKWNDVLSFFEKLSD